MANGKSVSVEIAYSSKGAKEAAADARNLGNAVEDFTKKLKSADFTAFDAAVNRLRRAEFGSTASGLNSTAEAARKAAGAIGLTAQQSTQLAFQLNDVAVQLAGGQNPFLVILQQGSQITPLFGGVVATLKKFAPALLGIGATIGPIFEAFRGASVGNKAAEEIVNLNNEAKKAGLSVQQLTSYMNALSGTGVKQDELTASFKSFRDQLISAQEAAKDAREKFNQAVAKTDPGKSFQAGTFKLPDSAFKALGINPEKLSRDANKAVEQLGAIYQKLPDIIQRNEFARVVEQKFGKPIADLATKAPGEVERIAAAYAKLAPPLSQEQIDLSTRVKQQADIIANIYAAIGKQADAAFVPAADAFNKLKFSIVANQDAVKAYLGFLRESGQTIADFWNGLGGDQAAKVNSPVIGDITDAIQSVIENIGKAKGIVSDFAGVFVDVARAIDSSAASVVGLNEKLGLTGIALQKVRDAVRDSNSNFSDGIEDAKRFSEYLGKEVKSLIALASVLYGKGGLALGVDANEFNARMERLAKASAEADAAARNFLTAGGNQDRRGENNQTPGIARNTPQGATLFGDAQTFAALTTATDKQTDAANRQAAALDNNIKAQERATEYANQRKSLAQTLEDRTKQIRDSFAPQQNLTPQQRMQRELAQATDDYYRGVEQAQRALGGRFGAPLGAFTAPTGERATAGVDQLNASAQTAASQITALGTAAQTVAEAPQQAQQVPVDSVARSASALAIELGKPITPLQDFASNVAQISSAITRAIQSINTSSNGAGATTGGSFASGGFVSGPGTATSDSIPAWLSNGEYVVRASRVKALGVGLLNAINGTASIPSLFGRRKYADGGLVGALPAGGGTSGNPVYVSIDRGEYIGPMKAGKSVIDQLLREETKRRVTSAGRAPSRVG